MISPIPERNMLAIRWALLAGWLALIGNLFIHAVCPVDGRLTHVMVSGTRCVQIQDHCVSVFQANVATTPPTPNVSVLFWGAIVPGVILILLVFGHVTWRRICPLSLVSQIPRIFGWQRLDHQGQPIRLGADHWIVKYHTQGQIGFLFIGLCMRLLFLNADSVWLGLWFLGTIAFAMTIGFLYAGKSWCQYFCPMAPVQHIFAEPVGLFTRKSHVQIQSPMQSSTQSPIQSPTQSMCRTSIGDRSACVACTSTCMDIDAERRYWDWVKRPETQWTYYGYLGLVLGFFGSFYLYAENWDYYFSGVWTRESTLIADSVQSGFYFFNRQFYVIKLFAVPVILAISGLSSYTVGRGIESLYLKWHQKIESNVSLVVLNHHLYSVWTVVSFNIFFAFAGRPFLCQIHEPWAVVSQVGLTLGLLIVSSLWLLRSLRRSPDRYVHERLTNRWMMQLQKSKIDLSQLLGGRSVHALTREDWIILRSTFATVVSPKHAPPIIDRSLLQTLVDEADQTLLGRYRRYQFWWMRRGVGRWVDREMSWAFKGDRLEGNVLTPKIPLTHCPPLHRPPPPHAVSHCEFPTPFVTHDPVPSVRSVILRNN